MSDLLPCPFCGSTDVHTSPNGENYAYVYCNTCGAEGPTNDIGSVVMTWNRRAQPAQAVPLLSDDLDRELVQSLKGAVEMGWISDDSRTAIEQAVRAKLGARVPMTEDQICNPSCAVCNNSPRHTNQ